MSRNAESGFVMNKIGNLILLLCPPLKSMQNKYTILKRYPILLPFSWIKRVFDAQSNRTKAVVKSVSGLSKSEAEKLGKFCINNGDNILIIKEMLFRGILRSFSNKSVLNSYKFFNKM